MIYIFALALLICNLSNATQTQVESKLEAQRTARAGQLPQKDVKAHAAQQVQFSQEVHQALSSYGITLRAQLDKVQAICCNSEQADGLKAVAS